MTPLLEYRLSQGCCRWLVGDSTKMIRLSELVAPEDTAIPGTTMQTQYQGLLDGWMDVEVKRHYDSAQGLMDGC